MPIYTKRGDRGNTRTFYGEMSKDDILAEALGSIDELNSWTGFVRSQLSKSKFSKGKLDDELKKIQNNLLIIGSGLAGSKAQRLRGTEVVHLERLIDKLTGELPPLKNFIYPVGEIQVARAVARRTERTLVRFMNQDLRFMNKNILKFLNRLSDALFTIARWVNYKKRIKEEVWK